MGSVTWHKKRLMDEMQGLGIYRAEYESLVKRCAEMRAERDAIWARYKKSGYQTGVVTAAGGEKSSPDMARLGQLERNLLALEDRLGVTPSAGQELGTAKDQTQEEKMAAIMEKLRDA